MVIYHFCYNFIGDKMNIIEKIRIIRETKKISRQQVADYLCIARDTYRDIEYGKIRLTLENYLMICQILKLSPMELLNESEDEHFILLNNKDITDMNRIVEKINNQINTINVNNIKNNIFNGDL